MSASSYPTPTRNFAHAIAALGLATLLACVAAAPATAGCGGGGGGGGKAATLAPVSVPNDPAAMKKLRDLTKRLKAEVRFDNQKSNAVRAKESGQAIDMQEIINSSPNQDDPDVKAAKDILAKWGDLVTPITPKY